MESARALDPRPREAVARAPPTPLAELGPNTTYTERVLANEDYAIQAALEASLADARDSNKENVLHSGQLMPPPLDSWSHRPMGQIANRQRRSLQATATATSTASHSNIATTSGAGPSRATAPSSNTPGHVRHRIVFRPDTDNTDSDSDSNGEEADSTGSQAETQLPLHLCNKDRGQTEVSSEVDTLGQVFPDGEPIVSQDMFSESSSDDNGVDVVPTSSEDTDYSDEEDLRNVLTTGGREGRKRLRENVLLAPCPKHLRAGNRRVANVSKEAVSNT